MDLKEKIALISLKRRQNSIILPMTAALLCGSGCAPQNLRELTPDEKQGVEDMLQFGPEHIMPIIESLAIESDQDKIFGFNGQTGFGAFSQSLWQTFDYFKELAENGEIYTFSDSKRTAGAAVYVEAGGYIATNRYFGAISPIGELNYGGESINRPYFIQDFGVMLHEAAHKWFDHKAALDGTQEDSLVYNWDEVEDERVYKAVQRQKDVPYLFSGLGGETYLMIYDEIQTLKLWKEHKDAFENKEISAQQLYDNFFISASDFVTEEYLEANYQGDWKKFDQEMFLDSEIFSLEKIIEQGLGLDEGKIIKAIEPTTLDRYNEFRQPFLDEFYEFVETYEGEIIREGERESEAQQERQKEVFGANFNPENFNYRHSL